MELKYKSNSLELKDIDEKQGIIQGYASVFGNKDSDGDVIVKGAYSKTINENKNRIAFLYQHDITKPIGKNLNLNEDAYGLKFEAQFSNSTLGRDVAIMAAEGIIKEVSVGFRTIKGAPKDDNYEIQEVKLYEYSLVTLAANPLAMVTDLKTEVEKKNYLLDRIISLESFMRKGAASDEAYRLIEFELGNIKNILSLKNEPQRTQEQEPTFDFNKFNNYLKP